MGFTGELFRFMATAAQGVELLFQPGTEPGRVKMASQAQTLAASVDEIMMASDALLVLMGSMVEGHGY